MKTFLLLCSLIAGSSLGEILCAKGMQQVGDVSLRPRALLGAVGRMFRNPWLYAGVSFLALSFFSFISLLSYADLSFVVPLTAVGYITNTVGARFLLKERISRERWMGTLLVAFGVAVISLDQRLESLVRAALAPWARELHALLAPREASGVVFGGIYAIRLALLICILAAIVYYGIAVVAGLLWFADRRRQRALGTAYTPPVTILKPVRGADTEAYENFASFCRQDYPTYQLLFGVRDESDPVVPILRRLQTDFPEREIEVVISAEEIGYNAKVSNLQNIFARVRHELLLIADSDIRVTPDYLRRVAAPMQRPEVGMVTCLYRGTQATTAGGLLENIGISSTFGPEVCTSRALEGIAFALGSTIVMRRELLERIGGFPALADYLADDFLLGNRAARAGCEVVLSDYVVEHVAAPDTIGAMLRHQLRWGRSTRISRPWGYRGLLLTYGTATALLALPAWNFAAFAWGLLGVTLLVRFLPVFLIGAIGLEDRALARYFWLVPIRDLITFGIWIVSFVGDEIEWRGSRFRVLPNGALAPARNPGESMTRYRNLFICLLLLLALPIGLAGCREKPPEATSGAKRFDLKGKVVSVDRPNHKVTIEHEEIRGYMEAMTMPFTLLDDWVYDELTPGAQIQATLIVDTGRTWLENPVVTKIADPSLARSEESGIEPSPGAEAPNFSLVNQDGKKIRFQQYRGRALLLTFIYTRCPLPDYCPLMCQNFVAVRQSLEKEPALAEKVHMLSITVDPEYDKPRVLREFGARYVGAGKPDAFRRWEFAGGSADEVKAVAQFFGLNYWPEKDQIIHGLRTAIVSPDGKVYKIYRGNEWKPEEVVEDLKKLNPGA